MRRAPGEPGTHLSDDGVQWEFWTRSPESAHEVTTLTSDRGTPDKILPGRVLSYPGAHRCRIGTNYRQLPVNRPAPRPAPTTATAVTAVTAVTAQN